VNQSPYTLENTEGAMKNEQSRESGTIGVADLFIFLFFGVAHVLFTLCLVRVYLHLFMGGLMSYLQRK
jgi:hypothetical protein